MTPPDRSRYLRQFIFAPLGEAGQEKLLAARVLLVGCGATGSVIANTLVRAGVGQLVIVDRDFVELNNLQRQILFDEEDIAEGLPKAVAAANKLAKINSSVAVEPVVADVNAENIEDLMRDAALVLDGTDNFETRYLVNDACVKHNKPWIYGGAVGSSGMTMNIRPIETACFRCIFPHAPAPGTLPTCDTAGVLAPIVNVIASLVCAEAIKLLTGALDQLNRGLVSIDLWDNSFETYSVHRRADCLTCQERTFEYLTAEQGTVTALLCGKNAVQIRPAHKHKVNLSYLANRLADLGSVSFNEYLLKFKTPRIELTVFPDARTIVQGTEDESVAKSLYAKYVGN
ncbi:MAG TPA: ThiF family adenylyltransferase [Anaerolineae bacterium]